MTEYIVEVEAGIEVDTVFVKDLQEVVRCRDCEHYDTEWTSEAHPGRHWCYVFCHYTEPDGFCAWGERRGA